MKEECLAARKALFTQLYKEIVGPVPENRFTMELLVVCLMQNMS